MALGVNIVSEFDAKGVNKAIKDFKKLETATDKMAFSMRTMDSAVTNGVKNLAKIGAVATIAAGIIGKQLVDAASNLEESISKVNVVFGDSAAEVHAFAKTAAESMGISRQEALEAAGTYGNLLQAFGTSRKEATKMSTTMVQLAGDLASFNNVPIKEALIAIRSGLSGESEPLKRFGVAINDVRLKEEALRLGLYKGSGTLSVLAKSQAAYALILKDTALAQGDYARTSDGVANTQRTLQAVFTDVKAELGTALIPVYQTLLSFISNSLMPVFREFAAVVGEQGLGGGLKYLGTQALDAIGKMGGWANVIYGIVTAVTALKVATIAFAIAEGLATIAVTAFGVAWNATGIGLIASAIGLAVVALVALIIKFKAFREFLIKVWNTAIDVVQKAINITLGYWEFWINKFIWGLNLIIKGWNKLPFGKKIPEIEKVNFALDITGAKIDSLNNKYKAVATSAANFRKAEEASTKKYREAGGSGLGSTLTPSVTGGGGQSAADKLKERLKKYGEIVKTTSSLQKDLKKAIEATGLANDKLANSNAKLASAQQTLLGITKGFGAASKEATSAQAAFDQAQRDGVRAGFELERAQTALIDAEKNMALVRNSKNPKTVRDAEIALAEAQMTVTEKQIALKEATDATAEAQRKLSGTINGFPQESEEYKTALSELIDAQREAKDAVDAVADAKQRELDITNQLIASNKKLAVMKSVGISKAQAKQVAKGMKSEGITITPEMWKTLGITPFAKGGIVTSPVNALIGEAGAEAVIPLDRMGDIMKGGDTNVTIHVTSADPNAVVDALRRYQLRNGSVPIRVSNL